MVYSPNLGTLLVDPQTGNLLAVDAQAAATLNINTTELARCNASDLLPGLAKELRASILDQNDKHQNDNHNREFSTLITRTDGCERSVKVCVVPLFGSQQDLLLLTLHPTSADQGGNPQRDALTGLPDRRELVGHYQRWQQAAGGKPLSCAVLFMDLDQFKLINDQHGHAVGDQVLVALAERWQSCVRDGDLVARYGGDEFVVLLAGIRSRTEVDPVIARLTTATSQPILIGGQKHSVGITIGIAFGAATTDEESNTLEQLLLAADRDMYASKRLK